MKLVFLYGPPAAGKLTIGREVAALTGYRLFHNHLTVDLGRELFEFGTPGFARVVDGTRMLVFETAASEGLDGLIFTFVYSAPGDDRFVAAVVELVERHGGEVCFVRLHCAPAVLRARIDAEDRRRFRKIVSPELLESLLARHELFAEVPGRLSLAINTSSVSPAEAARRIVAHYRLPVLETDDSA